MRTADICYGVVAASAIGPSMAFLPGPQTTTSRQIFSQRTATTPLRMAVNEKVEKVKVDVVQTPKSAKRSETAVKTDELLESAKETAQQIKTAFNDLNVENLGDDLSAAFEGLKTNVQSGKVGERGEVWALAQGALLFFLLLGDLPLLGGPLELLAGPGLLLAGLATTTAAIVTLGKNYSPWAEPPANSVLKTTGVYSLSRHPMYTGLILFAFGLGFSTDSFVRIALAGILAWVLDQTATQEEEALSKAHPAYKTYKDEVAKFFPKVY